METFKLIMSDKFTWGVLLGLILVIMTWRLMRKDIKQLKAENKRQEAVNKELNSHLNTQLKINSSGNEQLLSQLEDLKEQNENLRMNINTLNQKSGKAELRQLHILESAVGTMREQAPGFAPAWEKALKLSEEEHEKAENGLTKLIRKVLPSSKSSSSSSQLAIDTDE